MQHIASELQGTECSGINDGTAAPTTRARKAHACSQSLHDAVDVLQTLNGGGSSRPRVNDSVATSSTLPLTTHSLHDWLQSLLLLLLAGNLLHARVSTVSASPCCLPPQDLHVYVCTTHTPCTSHGKSVVALNCKHCWLDVGDEWNEM